MIIEDRIVEVKKERFVWKQHIQETQHEINRQSSIEPKTPAIHQALDKLHQDYNQAFMEREHLKRVLGALEIQKKRRDVIRREIKSITPGNGLTPDRMARLWHFEAEEADAVDPCCVCMEDIEVGRSVVRLDCKHVLCQVCTYRWMSISKTCPLCRHAHC